MLHLAVTRAAEELPSEYTFILDVRPDPGVFAYVLAISLLAGVLFGLAPAAASFSAAIATTISVFGVEQETARNLVLGAFEEDSYTLDKLRSRFAWILAREI